jgi:hypothetical protein
MTAFFYICEYLDITRAIFSTMATRKSPTTCRPCCGFEKVGRAIPVEYFRDSKEPHKREAVKTSGSGHLAHVYKGDFNFKLYIIREVCLYGRIGITIRFGIG